MARRKLTKRPAYKEDGEIVGYIRKSRVEWPEEGMSLDEKKAYLETVRQTRMIELIADAALYGDTISYFYDDLGISGAGQYLDKRVDFLEMREGARRGRIAKIYTRETSRLTRDFAQDDELWTEMETLGVLLIAGDLPTPALNETEEQRNARILIRRVLAAANDNDIRRTSARVSSSLSAKFSNGDVLGRTRHWGFTYDSETRSFQIDEEGRAAALLLFELFVQSGGNAAQTAVRLNKILMAGAPAALRPRKVQFWTRSSIITLVQSEVWHQCVSWQGRDETGYGINAQKYYRPDKIPRVVPEETLTHAKELLALRSRPNKKGDGTNFGKRQSYTYTSLCFCEHCAGSMRASTNQKGKHTQAVYYGCGTARKSRILCPDSFYLSERRIDATVGRAIKEMLVRLQSAAHVPAPIANTPIPRGPSPEERQALLEQRRQRLYDAVEDGTMPAAEVKKRLATIKAEMDAIEAEKPVEPIKSPNPFDRIPPEEWPKFVDEIMQYWQQSCEGYQQSKSIALRSLGIRVYVQAEKRRSLWKDKEVPGKIHARVMFDAFKPLGPELSSITIEEDDTDFKTLSKATHAPRSTSKASKSSPVSLAA